MSVNEDYVAKMPQSDRAGLVSLSPHECIEAYMAPFQSTNSDVLVVAEGSLWNPRSGHKTDVQSYSVNIAGPCDKRLSYQWMCSQLSIESCTDCDTFLERVVRDNITMWQPFGFPVKYCLSQPVDETCSLKFSVPIWWIVVAFNLIKIGLMGFIAQHNRAYRPLLTVGDAIASFLQQPDSGTTGMSLLSKRDITRRNLDQMASNPRPFKNAAQRKFSVASKTRWAMCALL